MTTRITVFGGSLPKPGDPAYIEAFQLGQMLGSAGYTVLTGGYIGTMEAVSRGAAEAGGHVIGVTCNEIEAWRAVKPNAWVHEEMRYATIHQRLLALIENCDAALALPGGIGTLTEVSLMWNQLVINAIAPRPLIAIGPGWQATFEQFFNSLPSYIPLTQRRWLTLAPGINSAFQQLQEMLSSGKV
ncbi:MAG TPA: LOG family protein [Anaerolineales bacterium]|nr:LOG family protein [Anaerolineales bacterium]